jgi:UDP-glucose 4-epimerase
MGFEHVIPQLIEKSLRLSHQDSDSKLIIQGSGQETRAFCYVDDVVRGIEILIEKGINGEIYNIGNPVETKIETVTGEILKILNLKLEIEQSLLKSGSPLRRCPSIDKISRLGFKPEVDLADGIRQTVNWYKNYFELNRNTYDG